VRALDSGGAGNRVPRLWPETRIPSAEGGCLSPRNLTLSDSIKWPIFVLLVAMGLLGLRFNRSFFYTFWCPVTALSKKSLASRASLRK
jgi:hypothetical protein